MQYGKIPHPVK